MNRLYSFEKWSIQEKRKSKPDYLDIDKDGDKKEPMKKAAKEARGSKGKKSKGKGLTAAQKKLPKALQDSILKRMTESSNNKIEEFIKRANKIINYDESEFEQGDEPSNVDILSELGDLCNELSLSSDDIKEVIDSKRVSDHMNYLGIILDETNIEDDNSELNWDDFLEDLKRDMGENISINTSDFRYLTKWLFDKIVNKKIVGDNYWEKPR